MSGARTPPSAPWSPRVISASKRTDLPAFHMPWVLQQFRQGWADVPSPRSSRVTRVSLLPEHVQGIVWWSKDYGPWLSHSAEFAAYRHYFQFSINPRRPDLQWLEPGVPPLAEVLCQVHALCELPGGPEAVAWRYDPIAFWCEGGEVLSSWDPAFFEEMCRALAPLGVRTCFTSVADPYAKYVRVMRRLHPGREPVLPSEAELAPVAAGMAEMAWEHGMRLLTCAEPLLQMRTGFAPGACINGALFGGSTAPASDRRMKGREACLCTAHTDIGSYAQACGFGCVYCYAG